MPKAKPVSLHPLTFEEAIKRLISIDTNKLRSTRKLKKRNQKHKKIQSS